jgi:hypothetical protein
MCDVANGWQLSTTTHKCEPVGKFVLCANWSRYRSSSHKLAQAL